MNRIRAQFKVFPENRLSFLLHDVRVKGRKDKTFAAFALAYAGAAIYAEEYSRKVGSRAGLWLLSALGVNVKKALDDMDQRDEKDGALLGYMKTVGRELPGVGEFMGVYTHKPNAPIASAIPYPVFSVPFAAVEGAARFQKAKTAHEEAAGFWEAFNAVAGLLGLGPLTQFGTVFSKVITGQAAPNYQSRVENLRSVPSGKRTESEKEELARREIDLNHYHAHRLELGKAFDDGDITRMKEAAMHMRVNLQNAIT